MNADEHLEEGGEAETLISRGVPTKTLEQIAKETDTNQRIFYTKRVIAALGSLVVAGLVTLVVAAGIH